MKRICSKTYSSGHSRLCWDLVCSPQTAMESLQKMVGPNFLSCLLFIIVGAPVEMKDFLMA